MSNASTTFWPVITDFYTPVTTSALGANISENKKQNNNKKRLLNKTWEAKEHILKNMGIQQANKT